MATTVLIVDDHAGFRSVARRLLDAAGYAVVGEAGDGAHAVSETERLAPELVLLDLHLPDASGLQIAEQLTAGPGAPAVVLTSSHDEPEFEALAKARGASGFVPKTALSAEALASALASG